MEHYSYWSKAAWKPNSGIAITFSDPHIEFVLLKGFSVACRCWYILSRGDINVITPCVGLLAVNKLMKIQLKIGLLPLLTLSR